MNSECAPDTALDLRNVEIWAGGMESRALTPLPEEFNSQQPHGDSQPSIMKSGALFWHVGEHTEDCILDNQSYKKETTIPTEVSG